MAVAVTQLPALVVQVFDQLGTFLRVERLPAYRAGGAFRLGELGDARFELVHFFLQARVFGPGIRLVLVELAQGDFLGGEALDELVEPFHVGLGLPGLVI